VGYEAGNHQDKGESHVWSLTSEKTGIVASERARLMEIIYVRRQGKERTEENDVKLGAFQSFSMEPLLQ
jgi:hypothetical protein